MILEAAMVMASCVLFIGMGLSTEVQKILGVSLKILNCPKCLSYWTTLIVFIAEKRPAVPTIAISFLASYAAMWLTLALDAATVKYNMLYEKITETPDAFQGSGDQEDTAPGADSLKADTDDEVSQMPIEHDTLRDD